MHKVTKKEYTKAVAIAKEEAYAELYKQLDTAEGNKIIYKLAKTRNRRTTYICDNIFKNDNEGKMQADTKNIIEVWKEHYVELLNVTNRRMWLEWMWEDLWPHTQHHVGRGWNTTQEDENWKSLWSGSDPDWGLEVVR